MLDVVGRLAPRGWEVRACAPLDALPFFNPDVEEAGPPDVARAWRAEVGWSDALVLSSPEYAHGVPGVLKNALDWLVGGVEIAGKPIAIFNATPPGTWAAASLRETLRVMGGRVVEAACVELPLRGSRRTAAELAAESEVSSRIRSALTALADSKGGADGTL